MKKIYLFLTPLFLLFFLFQPDFARAQDTGCVPDDITPNIAVDGTWTENIVHVEVNTGQGVKFGPWPRSGGSWTWKGPFGYTFTGREPAFEGVTIANAGVYTATYVNDAGCESTLDFTISVDGIGLAELKHSYTFEDGTATDVVGGANGTITGGAVSEGAYVTAANGDHIELPAGDIAINTYPAITLEAVITPGNNAERDFTMLSYFGGTANNLGVNGYFISPVRGDEKSRTAISTGAETEPYNVEDGVDGPELEDAAKHHLVSVLTNDSIYYYIDGVRQGATLIREGRSIADLSNDLALLAKGGYLNDPTWRGSIHEFNIYSGVMSPGTIEERAKEYLAVTEPTLSALTVQLGEDVQELAPAFGANVLDYVVLVPNGTSAVNITATPSAESSTVEGAGELQLVDGSGTATIVVTTPKGESFTYTVLVRERSNDATLSSITAMVGEEPVEVSPEFSSDVKEYQVVVPQGTTTVNITANPNNEGATVRGAGGISVVAGKGTATITVTAEDETEEVYVVNILEEGTEDNATLSALSFPQGTMTPEFDPEIMEYEVVVKGRHEIVNFIAHTTVEDASLEGENALGRYITLNEDGTATAVITVRAVDGETTQSYTINIRTEAPTAVGNGMSSLVKVYPTVSAGPFTVQFATTPGKVTVYDLSGKVIVEQNATSPEVQVNVPHAGMYIFQIQLKGESKKVKVFKVN